MKAVCLLQRRGGGGGGEVQPPTLNSSMVVECRGKRVAWDTVCVRS